MRQQYRTLFRWQSWLKVRRRLFLFIDLLRCYICTKSLYKIELKNSSASILSVGCVWLATEEYTLRAFTFEPGKKYGIECAMCAYHIISLPVSLLYSNKTLNLSMISFERFCVVLTYIYFIFIAGQLVYAARGFLCEIFSSRSSSASNGDWTQPKFMNNLFKSTNNLKLVVSNIKMVWALTHNLGVYRRDRKSKSEDGSNFFLKEEIITSAALTRGAK